MRKILLMPDAAESAANPQQQAGPPVAAEIVASGKSEREAVLERENAKLKNGIKKTAEKKRKVEIEAAHLADENHRLKQVPSPAPQPQPATTKKSWLGFWDEN